MSTIPPNWLGSIIQTSGAARRAAEERSKEATSQTDRAAGGSFAEGLQNVIENSDRDGEVFSDAEGQGSQGRPFGEEKLEEAVPESDQPELAEPGDALDLEA